MANKALLVGVNKYKYVRPLNGCVNDVRNMADILTSFYGFVSDDIRTLVDESATRNNLMNRFDWLLDGAQKGDLLLFHFSGHGSQIPDRNGDELDDGMDEILCLYDMDFRNPDSYLLDDDFNDIIDRLPKDVYLTVCVDSCHSGTATRDITLLTSGLQIPLTEAKLQPRFIEPPADIALRAYGKSVGIRRLGAMLKEDKNTTGANDTVKAKHILLAGCNDDQTSADAFINNDYNGAFTYNLCKTIRDMRGEITYLDLVKKIQNSLAFNSFSQVPQLNGNERLKATRFLSVPANNELTNERIPSLPTKIELTCEHGHPLICKEGHPPKGYPIQEKTEKEQQKPKTTKRIHIATKHSKCAISKDIILPPTSEFIGTVRDITNMVNSKEKQSGRRDVLGDAYNPVCLDYLEETKDFRIEKVLEFCPNEQRAFNVEEAVKPIPLAIRCNQDEEMVLLSYEDGVWAWHFKNDIDKNNRDVISDENQQINYFSVPFKVQCTTTRGVWSKVVHVIKFGKDWIQAGSSEAIRKLLGDYEAGHIVEGFKYIEHSKGFIEGLKKISDWSSIKDQLKDKKKALLFIHGTASSLAGGYEYVPAKILEALKEKYPVILGYDHATLSITPEDNANAMLKTLKESGLLDMGVKFDVVTHSRGGLVLRSLVELCGGYSNVENVIMVACPAAGTNLANPQKWDSLAKMINLLTNVFFFTGGAPLKVFFNLVGGLIKFASTKLEDPNAIPGVWAMNPNSDFIKRLNRTGSGINGTVKYNTIVSDFEPSGIFKGGIKDDIADSIADVYFGDPNDLIVDTDKMVVNWPKGIISGHNFSYQPEEHVYHLNYFQQAKTYTSFLEMFGVELKHVVEECIRENQLEVA